MNDLFLKLYVATRSVLSNESGQSASEYVMAVGLIALGCVAGETTIAHSVNNVFVSIATVIANGIAQ